MTEAVATGGESDRELGVGEKGLKLCVLIAHCPQDSPDLNSPLRVDS